MLSRPQLPNPSRTQAELDFLPHPASMHVYITHLPRPWQVDGVIYWWKMMCESGVHKPLLYKTYEDAKQDALRHDFIPHRVQ